VKFTLDQAWEEALHCSLLPLPYCTRFLAKYKARSVHQHCGNRWETQLSLVADKDQFRSKNPQAQSVQQESFRKFKTIELVAVMTAVNLWKAQKPQLRI
jgi:hypothetical protein